MRNNTSVAFIFTLLFAGNYSHFLISGDVNNTVPKPGRPINSQPAPDMFDWRELNMVSPVKDQGQCSACWAFSVVANIESHLRIYLNLHEILSEQFLLDCDEDNKGCGYGSILQTFADIVTKLSGVLREEDYFEYVEQPLDCRWHRKDQRYLSSRIVPNPSPVPVVGFRRVLPNEETMAQFVFKYGPLTAGINSASMANYTHGIDEPSDEQCDPKSLDHSVLIVGYNVYVSDTTGKRTPYWIIKNSWGENWGDNGYYYLVRGRNACGIASDVSFAFVN